MGINPGVITGKEGVLGFYNSVGEAVLFHSGDRLSVAAWGICDEITFHQLDAKLEAERGERFWVLEHAAR